MDQSQLAITIPVLSITPVELAIVIVSPASPVPVIVSVLSLVIVPDVGVSSVGKSATVSIVNTEELAGQVFQAMSV